MKYFPFARHGAIEGKEEGKKGGWMPFKLEKIEGKIMNPRLTAIAWGGIDWSPIRNSSDCWLLAKNMICIDPAHVSWGDKVGRGGGDSEGVGFVALRRSMDRTKALFSMWHYSKIGCCIFGASIHDNARQSWRSVLTYSLILFFLSNLTTSRFYTKICVNKS